MTDKFALKETRISEAFENAIKSKKMYYDLDHGGKHKSASVVNFQYVSHVFLVVGENGDLFNGCITGLNKMLSDKTNAGIDCRSITSRISPSPIISSNIPVQTKEEVQKEITIGRETNIFVNENSDIEHHGVFTSLVSKFLETLHLKHKPSMVRTQSLPAPPVNKPLPRSLSNFTPVSPGTAVTPVNVVSPANPVTSSQDLGTTKKIKKERKKGIPSPLRDIVWRKHFGSTLDGKCFCCDKPITFQNWDCSHIQAEARGGATEADNLRPCCGSCNKSMGTMHMDDYIIKYNLPGIKNIKH